MGNHHATTIIFILQTITHWIMLFLGSVFLISCSSSSSDEDTTTSLVTSSYEDLTTKLDELGSLSPDPESTASIFSFLESPQYAAAIATYWDSTDTIGLVDPEGGATPISIFDYLSIQFDPESERENDSATNVFGRIDDALSIFCAIDMVLMIWMMMGTLKLEIILLRLQIPFWILGKLTVTSHLIAV